MVDAGTARQRHESALMALPHVVGVGLGRDERTGQDAIVVFVDRLIPVTELRAEEVIPQSVEGVPIRVEPIDTVTAQT
jgi:hypothetical protein